MAANRASAGAPRIRGVVARWGPRGYGFISSREISRDVWCHINSIADAGIDVDQPLPVGLELEFETHRLDGGRVQAVAVTRPGIRPTQPGTAPPVQGAIRGLEHLKSVAVTRPLARHPSEQPSVTPPPQPPGGGGDDLSVGSRVLAERRRIEAERSRLDTEVHRWSRKAEAAEAQLPEVLKDFEVRIKDLEEERDRQYGALKKEAERYRKEVERAEATRDELPTVSAVSRTIFDEHIDRTRREVDDWLARRIAAKTELAHARSEAVRSAGDETVREYEEIRRRKSVAADAVEARAYGYAEQAARESIRCYAELLDRSADHHGARVTVLLVVPDGGGRLVLIAPTASDALDAEEAIRWRLGAFVVDAAERGAREMDASVTIGRVGRCFAVELRPWGAEPELIGLLLQEAWESRPMFAEFALSMSWDSLYGIDPPFEPIESDGEDSRPGEAHDPSGGDIRAVALRIGVSLADVIAALVGAGLPFPNDTIDVGVEESLRELVGIESAPNLLVAGERATVQLASFPDKSTPPMIVRRILAKLLRDSRIGGRHTSVDHVWGHHFSPDEKDLAREVTRRLVTSGILMVRRKTGSEHVSIDPRRMDDVRALIDLRDIGSDLLDGL